MGNETKQKKILSRTAQVFKFSFSSLLIPACTLLVSFYIIHFFSTALWGELVKMLLIVNLASYFLSYGNKDYLLKKFSSQPGSIYHTWQVCLLVRSSLFLIVIPALLLFNFTTSLKALLVTWVIIRFLYTSYDSRIIYSKKFSYSVICEILGFLIIILFLTRAPRDLSLCKLMALFIISDAVKLLTLFLLFRKEKPGTFSLAFDRSYFIVAFPFFILTFSGLVQSRIDQLLVNSFLPDDEIAKYQVLMSFLLYALAVPNYIIVPHLKNYYRLSKMQFKKLMLSFVFYGIAIVPLAAFSIYVVVRSVYRFKFDPESYATCALFLLPAFFYTPIAYFCFKHHRQSSVVLVTFIGVAANILSGLLLIPDYGIKGALLAAAASQWVMFFIYFFIFRRLLKNEFKNASL